MNVLFVCTGNTCRSPMAEGILKFLVRKENLDIDVNSAGVFANPGSPASTNAILSMKDIGINIENHRSQIITKEIIENSDLILTMTSSHKDVLISNYPEIKEKVFSLNEYAFQNNKDIKDPYGGDKDTYDIARDEIMDAIKKIYNDLKM